MWLVITNRATINSSFLFFIEFIMQKDTSCPASQPRTLTAVYKRGIQRSEKMPSLSAFRKMDTWACVRGALWKYSLLFCHQFDFCSVEQDDDQEIEFYRGDMWVFALYFTSHLLMWQGQCCHFTSNYRVGRAEAQETGWSPASWLLLVCSDYRSEGYHFKNLG